MITLHLDLPMYIVHPSLFFLSPPLLTRPCLLPPPACSPSSSISFFRFLLSDLFLSTSSPIFPSFLLHFSLPFHHLSFIYDFFVLSPYFLISASSLPHLLFSTPSLISPSSLSYVRISPSSLLHLSGPLLAFIPFFYFSLHSPPSPLSISLFSLFVLHLSTSPYPISHPLTFF